MSVSESLIHVCGCEPKHVLNEGVHGCGFELGCMHYDSDFAFDLHATNQLLQ